MPTPPKGAGKPNAKGKKGAGLTTGSRPGAHFWLMKTEPETFSFEDLLRAPKHTSPWEGVRNYQARNLMRDEFKLGDEVFIYHSSCAEPGIIGTARVVREAYPDPTALQPESLYFDEKSVAAGSSRWCMVDVRAATRFAKPVLLKDLRLDPRFATMMLLQKGARLSVQPVTPEHWQLVVAEADVAERY